MSSLLGLTIRSCTELRMSISVILHQRNSKYGDTIISTYRLFKNNLNVLLLHQRHRLCLLEEICMGV